MLDLEETLQVVVLLFMQEVEGLELFRVRREIMVKAYMLHQCKVLRVEEVVEEVIIPVLYMVEGALVVELIIMGFGNRGIKVEMASAGLNISIQRNKPLPFGRGLF